MRSLTTLLLGITLAAAAPALAAAAEPGVHVDPDSPSGKEYAIPLDSVRRDAGGRGSAEPGGGGAPLFGAGISSAPRSTRGGSGATHRSGSGRKPAKQDRSGSGERKAAVAAASAGAGSDGSTALTSAAIGLAVLLAGGALGLVLRRTLR